MKTIKIPELKIEVEAKIHDKGKTLKEIKIPKGWRLLRIEEALFLYNNKKYRKALNMKDTWEFIEQPFEINRKKGFVARLYAFSVWADFSCNREPSVSVASLGVRFCKEKN